MILKKDEGEDCEENIVLASKNILYNGAETEMNEINQYLESLQMDNEVIGEFIPFLEEQKGLFMEISSNDISSMEQYHDFLKLFLLFEDVKSFTSDTEFQKDIHLFERRLEFYRDEINQSMNDIYENI